MYDVTIFKNYKILIYIEKEVNLYLNFNNWYSRLIDI